MKTKIKFYLTILILFFTCINSYSQISKIDYSKYKIGTAYKVLLLNSWETEGILVGIDSNTIQIKSEIKTYNIKKADIDQIIIPEYDFVIADNNYFVPEETVSRVFYFGGPGIYFSGVNSNDSYSSGINIQVGIGKYTSPNSGIRGVFQFSQNPKNNNNYSNSFNVEGGNLNSYSLTFNYLFGNFKHSSDFNIYGLVGGGFGIDHLTDRRYNSSNGGTYESKGYNVKKIMVELGTGLNYRVSNKARIFGEFTYGFPILYLESRAGFYPLQSIQYGHPSAKIGLQMDM